MKPPTIDHMIVSVSGGKDSLATIDICVRQFKEIRAFWMYYIKGLRFQEVVMQSIERRYGIEILRLPHFDLSWLLGSQMLQWYRASYPEFGVTTMREMQDLVRDRFGISWIATGEKMADSFTRRFMMKANNSSQWDFKRGCYYPLQRWTNTQVFQYLKLRHIPLPPEYRFMKGSWGGMRGSELHQVKLHFPEDYKKILEVFPFAAAIERNYEIYRLDQPVFPSRKAAAGTNTIPEIRDGQDTAVATEQGAIQPKND